MISVICILCLLDTSEVAIWKAMALCIIHLILTLYTLFISNNVQHLLLTNILNLCTMHLILTLYTLHLKQCTALACYKYFK
jgi:hypothetical protein